MLKGEREAAKKIYDQEQEKIRETVAFGRRSEGPPGLYYPAKEMHLTKFGRYICAYQNLAMSNFSYSYSSRALNLSKVFCSIHLAQ